ncbi:3'-5' exonuclease KapD [Kyrpidia spormannii]|uniref:3'-5' exonuclease KapD n=1 Tax=Kyrpidia spormannii TaxID=2055160 RepID=A0ACA8Z8U8_9BACL|nr:3'-5' exonuclease KapD [Kyrpidia spormannii]CAB3391402.1 putative 3'-5' exonuclease KapD [Kyrpidia spormannii]
MSEQLLFLDFEFTMPEDRSTPEQFRPEIIELGLVSVIDGEIFDRLSTFVRPMRFPTLTERCKNFLQIRQEDVDAGISFRELVETLQTYVELCPTTPVTWGNADLQVLRENCSHAGLPFPFDRRERDLSLEYKRFFGNRQQTGLWKAIEEYGRTGVGRHHRALDDALTTVEIFRMIEKDKEYLNRRERMTLGDRVDLEDVWKKLHDWQVKTAK